MISWLSVTAFVNFPFWMTTPRVEHCVPQVCLRLASRSKHLEVRPSSPSRYLLLKRCEGLVVVAGFLLRSKYFLVMVKHQGKALVQTATSNVCIFVNAQGGRCDQEAASQLQQRWAAI